MKGMAQYLQNTSILTKVSSCKLVDLHRALTDPILELVLTYNLDKSCALRGKEGTLD